MSLIGDAGLENFHDLLGCKLRQSKDILKRTVENALITSPIAYGIRTNAIKNLSEVSQEEGEDIDQMLKEVNEIETSLETFLNPDSEDLQKLQVGFIIGVAKNGLYLKKLIIIILIK